MGAVSAYRVSGLLVALLILISSSPVRAQETPAAPVVAPTTQPASIEDTIRNALPLLKDRDTGEASVLQLQALRDERVLHVFEHIKAKELYTWQNQVVVVREVKGQNQYEVFDLFAPIDDAGAFSGKPLATVPKTDIPESAAIPVAGAVRRQIVDTLRVLGLKINDPSVRRKAARDLGLRVQEDALAELKLLAQNDPDSAVRRDAESAVNTIIMAGADPAITPEQRLAAIQRLGELQSLATLDVLKERAAKPGISPQESAAYGQAIKKIERHASVVKWLQSIFSGISLGSIYVLLALGLAITFGLMGVINMAHGEMMMVGGITTWACFEFISPHLPPAYFDWYYVIAFPASFLAAAMVGLLIEVTIVRYLYKRPLDSLLATIGVGYILIQSVRLWKGDNLGMRGPSWANGSWEIVPDVVLGYARLFLIGLTIFCVASIVLILNFTPMGLMVRATVQNREMAQAMGVNTRRVDMFTFSLGAGLAGLAGYGIVLTGTNPTPEMGQTFIVKTFLTVVVGGVGKLAGVIVSGLSIGFIEKLLEPLNISWGWLKVSFDATWSQVMALLAVVLFMQRRPSGLFPEKGRMADQADRISMPFLTKTTPRGDRMLGGAMILVGLIIVPLLYVTGLMSLEFVNKLGYIFSFAICAIGLDLIWGYIGVLSLCQFMFFSIGGYCMGLYLVNYGPMDGEHKDIPRALFVVMSAVSGATPPVFLQFFRSFPIAIFLGLAIPGVIALLIGLSTFRSRVRGVYFSILTQAITVGAWLIFQKNELKLGGTNGLTNFTQILGFPLAAKTFPVRGEGQSYFAWLGAYAGVAVTQTRFWLYIASFVMLMAALVIGKKLVHSGFGRVLVAIRDDETRLRFVGYQTWAYKVTAFTLAALFAAIGGMLYVPQKGIITPHQIAAASSILVVAWVAVGGRGSLWGAVFGAIFVSLVYEYMTSLAPQIWYFMLGGLFVIVPLLLPGGLMSIPKVLGLRFNQDGRESRRGFEVASKTTAIEGN